MSTSPQPIAPRRAVRSSRVRWLAPLIAAALVLTASMFVSPPSQAAGLLPSSVKPQVKAVATRASAEIGVRFTPASNGKVSALQFYRGAKQKNKKFVGSLWSATGKRLATATFAKSSRTGWQTAKLKKAVAVAAGRQYTVSYLATGGHYPASHGTFAKKYKKGGLVVPKNGSVRHWGATSAFPTVSVGKGANFLVDVVFTPSKTTSTTAPSTGATPTPVPSPPSAAGSGTVQTGFPNAASTGVRPGVALRDSGSITVNTPGTVIQGLSVSGTITVNASNVVIRDTLIRGGGNGYPIRITSGVKNTLIEYVEIDNLNSTGIGIFFNGGSGRVRYADIHSAEDGIRVGADDVVVEYSYIHDLYRQPGGHHDTLQIRSGDNVTLRGNTFLPYVASTGDPMNAAIQVGSLTGAPLRNFRVIDNYMDGGNYTVNGGDSSNVASGEFSGNVFGPHPRYGARMGISSSVVWSNNLWAANGATVG